MGLDIASCHRARLEAAERLLAEYAHRYGLTPQARAFFASHRDEGNVGPPGQVSTFAPAASQLPFSRVDLTLVFWG